MTKGQRSNILNAIWLCSNCATKIDRDPIIFSVDLLNTWKKLAEESSRQEIGNKLPSQQDIINTVSTVLSGKSTTFMPEAIRNVCKASTVALENLDPRFSVSASYQDEKTSFSLSVKEDVNFNLLIKKGFEKEFVEKYEKLVTHGEPLIIDGQAILMQGSRLLETISTDTSKGKFVLTLGSGKVAILKIWLANKTNRGDLFLLNDVVGEIVGGKESISFRGSAYDGFLEFVTRKAFNSDDPNKIEFQMNLKLDKWDSIATTKLPYFEQLYHFYKHLREGWDINSKLEVDGHIVLSGFTPGGDTTTNINNPYLLFRFIFLINAISKHLGKPIYFKTPFKYSRDTHEKIYEIYRIISEDNVCKFGQIENNAKCTLIAAENLANINILTQSTEPQSLKIEPEVAKVNLFGEEIELPKYVYLLTKVSPRIYQDISRIKPGDEVEVEWIPEKGCEFVTAFAGK